LHIEQITENKLTTLLEELETQYATLKARGLALDLTRGKPCEEQLALSDRLDGILKGNYLAADGTDTRNYGVLEGLPEARALFGEILGTPAEETLVGGNASLNLMYTTIDFALTAGLRGPESAWGNSDVVKFLCPAPGYDRHFAICEHLGIEMINVPMLDSGPDMDFAESAVKEDDNIRGIWCIPRFSNPTGCVYSDDTVERIAGLANLTADHFVVMWDNAYAVHTLAEGVPELASIREASLRQHTLDSIFQFGSTSKVTFAGAGVSFMSSSRENLDALVKHLSFSTIGPDKINQLRHVRFFSAPEASVENIKKHMAAHADIIRPRFEAVLNALDRELSGTGMGTWLAPQGGYFISFDTLPGLAKEVVRLANDIGVKLTPAGATFPYGEDPNDSNIRLAPTFPKLDDVVATAEVFTLCVKLATLRQKATGG
jgi:aspartate/methionine/tyrosine aminotransferase